MLPPAAADDKNFHDGATITRIPRRCQRARTRLDSQGLAFVPRMVFHRSRMRISVPPWDFIVILLALATIAPWRGVVRVRALLARSSITSADRLGIYASTTTLQWFAVGLTAWRCAARGLNARSLGIALPRPATTIAMGASMVLLFACTQMLGF